MNTVVYSVMEYGGELVAAGSFITAGGQPINHIARWNGSSWRPIGTGLVSSSLALTIYDEHLIASGTFDADLDGPVRWLNCPCPADLNGDSHVNIIDLLSVVSRWGPCPPPPPVCSADLAPPGGDNVVNILDLLAVVAAWGACP